MNKQYLLFAGDNYYPQGGADDFKGLFASIEEATGSHDPKHYCENGNWAHVFDLKQEKIVKICVDGEWIDFNGRIYYKRQNLDY